MGFKLFIVYKILFLINDFFLYDFNTILSVLQCQPLAALNFHLLKRSFN